MTTSKNTNEPKPAATPSPAPTYTIQHCSVTNSSAANEHTRAAVEALARAAEANARAIEAIANGLKGSPATIENGFRLGGN